LLTLPLAATGIFLVPPGQTPAAAYNSKGMVAGDVTEAPVVVDFLIQLLCGYM